MPARNLELALRIRADVESARQGLARVERELDDVAGAARKAGRGSAEAARGMTRLGGAAGRVRGPVRAFSAALAALGAAREVRAIVEAGLEAERLGARFRVAAGDAAGAAMEMAFVRAEADRLGIDLAAAADAYSGFAVAARGTALEGQAAREIFSAVAEASRVMGLSADQTAGAMLALEQIVSKGTVSAEELRGQLGERLPGAFQIASRAMGVTTSELGKMLQRGEVLAEDLLPRFAAELRRSVAAGVPAASQSAGAAFARLGNAIRELRTAIAESGLLDWLARVAGAAAGAARAVASIGAPRPVRDLVKDLDQIARRQTFFISESRRNILTAVRQVISGDRDPLPAGLIEYIRSQRDEGRLNLTDSQLAAAGGDLRAILAEIRAAIPGSPSGSTMGKRLRARETAVVSELEDEGFGATPPDRRGPSLDAGPIPTTTAFDADPAVIAAALQEVAALRARAAAETLALTRRTMDELDSITLSRSEMIDREERRRLAFVRVRLDDGLIDETQAAVAIATIHALAYEQRHKLLREQAAEERDALRQEAEDQKRAADEAVRIAEEEARRVADAIRAAQERREATEPLAGAQRALRDYVAEVDELGAEIGDGIRDTFASLEDALTQFVSTGRISFRSLADSIISDLARIAIRQAITGPLAAGLGSALGSLFGGGAPAGPSAIGPPAFEGVRRYHAGGIVGGLRPDEVPAILQRGEIVLPRGAGLAHPPEVHINIENRGAQPLRETGRAPRFDGRRWVVDIVTEDVADGGRIAQAVGRTFGARPATA